MMVIGIVQFSYRTSLIDPNITLRNKTRVSKYKTKSTFTTALFIMKRAARDCLSREMTITEEQEVVPFRENRQKKRGN